MKSITGSCVKCSIFASDGTSVNTGLKNGQTKLYVDKMSWVGSVSCFSHELEFAFQDVLPDLMNSVARNL